MNDAIKHTALETISLEAESIYNLQQYINDTFVQAVQIINATKGRVVVTGIGKSAIVGQKIVATLNSTGTPALFMHAADAIHGDLGMIQADDVVIILSKSGESPEIKVLVPLIKNFGNNIIAIVGNTNSYLANEAHYCLNTTVSKEACPNNLAPTSSTTAQMVMGDALAVCLMQLKGFTGADFAKYHPGGNLGKRLYLQVQDLSKNNSKPSVNIDASLKEIILVISKSLLGITGVINSNNEVIGIITDGDLRRMLVNIDNLTNITAAQIMNQNPKKIHQHALAVNALDMLREHDISQLIVVNDNDEYVGVLHLHDLVKEGII